LRGHMCPGDFTVQTVSVRCGPHHRSGLRATEQVFLFVCHVSMALAHIGITQHVAITAWVSDSFRMTFTGRLDAPTTFRLSHLGGFGGADPKVRLWEYLHWGIAHVSFDGMRLPNGGRYRHGVNGRRRRLYSVHDGWRTRFTQLNSTQFIDI
jgi:hypothetical protein